MTPIFGASVCDSWRHVGRKRRIRQWREQRLDLSDRQRHTEREGEAWIFIPLLSPSSVCFFVVYLFLRESVFMCLEYYVTNVRPIHESSWNKSVSDKEEQPKHWPKPCSPHSMSTFHVINPNQVSLYDHFRQVVSFTVAFVVSISTAHPSQFGIQRSCTGLDSPNGG